MIAAPSLKRWYLVHKWTSLVCTAFLLLICLTGLPLVFRDEIDQWLQPHHYVPLPADTPQVSLDRLATAAHRLYPDDVIASMFADDDEPQIYVWMAPSFPQMQAQPKTMHFIRFDARTGEMLQTSKTAAEQPKTFIDIMLALHTDLFVNLPGELFLAAMALLFVIAIASGVVLYGPFMKKLKFGTVRSNRSSRLKWLDIHNLLGITVMAWTLVVGITGVMNELSTPLFALWQQTDVKSLLASYKQATVPPQSALPSVQAALQTANRAVPGMTVTSAVYPGNPYGSPYHYLFWAKGSSTLTSRLLTPILVDARSGQLSAVVGMPWYLRALEVSRPLHFGDYGGLPLKILWALLDLITIVILVSGLYLWIARRKSQAARLARIIAAHQGEQITNAASP
jgi:uncharacterized iron-regulated membrane protein